MVSKASLPRKAAGLSYVEALVALVLTAMLLTVLTRVVSTTAEARDTASATHDVLEESRYALERMVRAVSRSHHLLIPQVENPATPHSESIRSPGVLAVMLDQTRDLDSDGIPDADDDGDGRFDEDTPKDTFDDGKAGIYEIDDDGDGLVDEGSQEDDDEDGGINEDPIDGVDNDGDGMIDEDPPDDMNADLMSGIAGFDDDGDGLTDESAKEDDDEDGPKDEDLWEAEVFFLSGDRLKERVPVPWDEPGLDYVEKTLADNVTEFKVERKSAPNAGPPLVTITLERTDAQGNSSSQVVTVRTGGAL